MACMACVSKHAFGGKGTLHRRIDDLQKRMEDLRSGLNGRIDGFRSETALSAVLPAAEEETTMGSSEVEEDSI